jgi:hypothetical protein
MELRANARRQDTTAPHRAAPPRRTESMPALLAVQRAAGNQAATMLVQRATAEQTAAAKAQADADFDAGRSADYFAGNFLANHIEAAQPEVAQAKKGKGVMSSKEARGQAWKKLAERSDIDQGGSGWGVAKKQTGTNTLILDMSGVQMKILMRAVNVAQIDQLATRPPVRWFEFYSDDTVPAVTFSSDGRRQEQKGKAHLGARYDAAGDRYKIDHLSGVG